MCISPEALARSSQRRENPVLHGPLKWERALYARILVVMRRASRITIRDAAMRMVGEGMSKEAIEMIWNYNLVWDYMEARKERSTIVAMSEAQ